MKNNVAIRYKMTYKRVLFRIVILSFISFVFMLFSSCGDDDDEIIVPKPQAYYRLDFPKKEYIKYDSICPFSFEMPTYSVVEKDKDLKAEPCWLNLTFPKFRATLHLSYKEVHNNIKSYLDDTYLLASKHQIKASGMQEQLIKRDSSKVYGLIYDISGNAASSFQFFLTDSTNHFIRGALYFYAAPNADSIAPVEDFLKKDLYKMINTFEWK